ncbi:MAG: alpha/beta hydrolase, partial [Pseudomonadota bacterium]
TASYCLAAFSNLPPVLHLGAGGPGAPMYLDSIESVFFILETHDAISLQQGRDLILIDPRGSGLSQPLLSCQRFVDNEIGRLSQNLTAEQEFESVRSDYLSCIDDFSDQGIDFKQYNSWQIMYDIEALRRAMKVEQWVLVGVSYATIYAQLVAANFPQTVEALILDSTTFLESEPHRSYVEQSLTPYRAMLNYCDYSTACDKTPENFETRFWAVHQALNHHPISLDLRHPYRNSRLTYVLNGERMLAALLEGVYDSHLFVQLPDIISQLEDRKTELLEPHINGSLGYLLDRTFGDVSSDAHYCYETHPYTDIEFIRTELEKLPEGYLRDSSLQWLGWGDYCDAMGIESGNPDMLQTGPIKQPVLFLHGEHDPVTTISALLNRQSDFPNSQLVRFDLSHSVLTSSEKAEQEAASFIRSR